MSSTITNSAFSGKTIKVEQFDENEKLSVQEKLEKKLGPEYISTRPGAGGVRVSYIEGWKAVNLANAIFGFNGWYSEVKNITVDYLDSSNGKFGVGISATIRVILKDGAYHEDIGYGSIENARTKAAAFEKAKKEAVTDGLKRALRSFGNAMGNCLYDKEYLKRIHGVKVAPPDFDESLLMRYADNTAPSTRNNTIPSNTRTNTMTSRKLDEPIQEQPQAQTSHHHQQTRTTLPAQHAASFPLQQSPKLNAPNRYPPPQALRNQQQQQNQNNQVQPQPPTKTIPEKRPLETPNNKKIYEGIDFDDSVTFSDEDEDIPNTDDDEELDKLLEERDRTKALQQISSGGSSTTEAHTDAHTDASFKENETLPSSVTRSQSEQDTNNHSINQEQPTNNNNSNRVQAAAQTPVNNNNNNNNSNSNSNSASQQNEQPIMPVNIPAQVGFFTARVADKVQNNDASIAKDDQFNPHFISPSMRRTVDQTKSAPIKRATTPLADKTIRFDNPRMIPNRQIGKPRYPPPAKRHKVDENSNGNQQQS